MRERRGKTSVNESQRERASQGERETQSLYELRHARTMLGGEPQGSWRGPTFGNVGYVCAEMYLLKAS